MKNEDMAPTMRNQSYCGKDIGKLINSELPELIPDYIQIAKELDEYEDQELKNMVNPLNLSSTIMIILLRFTIC